MTGPAILGEEQRLCGPPCHHAPIRFTDGRVPPVPPVGDGMAAVTADPGRVELVDGNVVVTVPCCPRSVVLGREELHPRALRRVACRRGAWRLEFLADAQATWTAVWTPAWSEPALRPWRWRAVWR